MLVVCNVRAGCELGVTVELYTPFREVGRGTSDAVRVLRITACGELLTPLQFKPFLLVHFHFGLRLA